MNLGSRKLGSRYEPGSDTVFLFGKGKVSDSEAIGDLVLHYSSDGIVLGVEFLNATLTLAPLLVRPPAWMMDGKSRVTRKALGRILGADATVLSVGSFLVLVLRLNVSGEAEPVEAKFNVPLLFASDLAVAKAVA
ncbi:MAG: DUF2283 domain-containing protein [Candidatus Micrarchaeia archaeon]|jgi:uncharacterized protein YuzE